MSGDVDDELSEMETRLREEGTSQQDCPEYYLSEEAENAILERLWERVADRDTKLENDLLELKDDFRKLSKLILARIHLQDDANRLAGEKEEVGNPNNRESTMSEKNQEEGKSKGFDVKKAAMIGGGVVLAAGAGYGIGRWHASKIAAKQSQGAAPSK